MKDEAVTTVAPISDADRGAHKVPNGGATLLCTTVCDNGLKCGTDWPKCTNPLRCVEERGCFWRRWHGIPGDKMRLQLFTETGQRVTLKL